MTNLKPLLHRNFRLSASNASRWIACPASYGYGAKIAEEQPKTYKDIIDSYALEEKQDANRGTVTHFLASVQLWLDVYRLKDFGALGSITIDFDFDIGFRYLSPLITKETTATSFLKLLAESWKDLDTPNSKIIKDNLEHLSSYPVNEQEDIEDMARGWSAYVLNSIREKLTSSQSKLKEIIQTAFAIRESTPGYLLAIKPTVHLALERTLPFLNQTVFDLEREGYEVPKNLKESTTTPDLVAIYYLEASATERVLPLMIALDVFDLKSGFNEILAKDNRQLESYYLSALFTYGENFETITSDGKQVLEIGSSLHIYQPNLDDNSNEFKVSFNEVSYLRQFFLYKIRETLDYYSGVKELSPASLKLGDHCKYCPILAVCPAQKARVDQSEALAPILNQASPLLPETWAAQDLAKFLKAWPSIEKFAESVKLVALARALNGEEFEGFELKDGRSYRYLDNETMTQDELFEILQANGVADPYRPREFKTLGDIEAEIGKKKLDSLGILKKSMPKKVLKSTEKKTKTKEIQTTADIFDQAD